MQTAQNNRCLAALVGVAILSGGMNTGVLGAGVAFAQEPVVAPSVVWPEGAGVVRRGVNGLSIDGGLASVEASADYVLTALTVSSDDIIRFTYAESAAPEAETAGACDFTFRHVERTLTQSEGNALAERLSGMEMRKLVEARRGLQLTGPSTPRGTAVVRHHVQAYVQGSVDNRVRGLGKTWIFVREGKAYYVHKRCETHGSAAMLTELDRRIGLDYLPDPAPTAPANP